MKRAAFFVFLTGTFVGVGAQSGNEIPTEINQQREALAQTRARITLEHEQMAKDCWQKFAVNDCLSVVRKSRRTQLDPIHQNELELNAQEREWRAQQRDERLKSKRQESGGSREQ